ncbi:MAG: bifunctional phosphoribosylaminoimidazolecarboxamide formyltransferase/inosine monophosphate cyclohydrolase [Candidatus Zixiibacteriota bacterium]|nr:MAG: bifunctional phosphoribosylaminoimidazolecarboxamide formyltransferase/inosine monophosphate cyclohydrolase [candidate division Zixibacteria bacterium]
MNGEVKIKRALISVSDKTGIEKLAQGLADMDVEILSTGGTLKTIKDAGLHAISVSTFTGSPEILDGRVKTLHPKIHAGLLARRDNQSDLETINEADYRLIDLVVVNLYPFEQTIARSDATDAEIIENIDIGGPSMLRSASKNYASVTVVVDPSDYKQLLKEMEANDGATSLEFRRQCAAKAFALTSRYDTSIARYFAAATKEETEMFPPTLKPSFTFRSGLRYGENPHQSAALYIADEYKGPTLLDGQILSGKELSYNNYGDLDSCLDMLLDFKEPFACVVKHANPCGAAVGETIAQAYKDAYDSDPLSAFGSIIGLNREVDIDCAKLLHETPFVECMIAPSFTKEAFKLLKRKKARRLLALPQIAEGFPTGYVVSKYIRGGLLLQAQDELETNPDELKVVTKREPTPEELKSLLFAWKVVKHTKSNAIVLAKGNATVGIGMGQTSRVDSGFMAVKRAGGRAKGAVMASDAFYPMPDGVEVGTDAGVTAIIQPGGSKGDDAAIEVANKAGAAMVFTGHRHFKH